MLRIPYVPTAYPDETFGSLLTRLVLHNGPGLWRSLLEECGYGRRTISTFYAMPVRDDRLDRLLAALGYTYSEMLQKLTALPFWLAFNNASRPRDRIAIDATRGNGLHLSRVGIGHTLSGARYCPACIADDMRAHGEPYLHRHHQLPVALVCAKHGVGLRVTCRACGVVVLPFNKALLPPPTLRCRCGHDLSETTAPSPDDRSSLQRLSQFGRDTLSCNEAPWTAQHIRTLLLTRMDCKPRDFNRQAIDVMQETYGPMSRSASGLQVTLLLRGDDEIPLRLGALAGLRRAPEYCALLSAIGLDFEEFKLASTAVKLTPARSARTPPRAWTIEQARLEFDRLASEFPKQAVERLHRSAPRLYWLLRLQDSAWLQQRGVEFQRSIPSIDEDRTKVDRALSASGRSLRTMRNSGPWIRAHLRDATWLRKRLNRRPAIDGTDEGRAQQVQRERAIALSRALFSVLRSEGRPARIHAGLLSKLAQLSMSQAQHAIANSPPLRTLIAAVNAGKNRRRAAWAARTLISAGARPTAKDVLVHAGLVTTSVNRQLAITAIERFTICAP